MHEARLKSSTELLRRNFAETTREPGSPTSIWKPPLTGIVWMRAFSGKRQEYARALLAVILLGIEPAGKWPIFVSQAVAKRVFPLAFA